MSDLIDRQAAIDAVNELTKWYLETYHETRPTTVAVIDRLMELPSAEPEIIRCKDCVYGEQDDIGRWFCNNFGCQVGDEDGSGFCADGERRGN